MLWATTWIGYFYLLTFIIGFGAITFVLTNPEFLDAKGGLLGGGNMAAIHLANAVGGNVFLGFISAVAFATILAVVAGLTLSGASAVSHDLYATVIKKGKADSAAELKVSRMTTIALGVVAVALGIVFEKQNIAFMVSLAFAIAASANFPVLLMSVLWKDCTTRGAVIGGFLGLVSSVLLTIVSPSVWEATLGNPKGSALFPYASPALFSMTIGFVGIWLFSILDRSARARQDRAGFLAQQVRSETGIGARARADTEAANDSTCSARSIDMSKRDVVVLSAARSAIGTFGGALSDIEPAELAGTVMKEAVTRSGVDPKAINYVTVGNTHPDRSRFAYVARVAAIQAGLPMDSVAMSVNRLCSSGLQGIVTTAQNILLGDCDYGVGGGVEVMSRGGYLSHRDAQRRAHGRHQADRHDGRHADRPVRRRPHGHHRREPGRQVGHHARGAGRAGGRVAPPRRGGDRRRAASSRRSCRSSSRPGRARSSSTPTSTSRPSTTLETLAKMKPAFKKDGGR